MRIVTVNEGIIGEKLAHPVYNENGMLYINNGIEIKESTLRNIKKIGITTVYIEDDNPIVLEETLETRKHLSLVKILKEEFKSIKKNQKINDKVIKEVILEVIENINISENAYRPTTIESEEEIDKLVMHSLDVAILSITIGLQMKYNFDKLAVLGMGALLHDIGKLADSKEDHATAGLKLARQNSSILPTALTCIYQHHEHYDGTGFPQGLKGEKIYEYARIVSICNEHINSLAENKLPHESAERLAAKSVNIFDKEIVTTFLHSVVCYPNGLSVELSDGNKGIVVRQNKDFPQRPVLQVVSNGDKRKVNLLKELTYFISAVSL